MEQDRCPREHPRTPENTYTKPDGSITCRSCATEATRRSRARKRNRQEANTEAAMERKYAKRLDLTWHNQAKCRGMDVSTFYAPDIADFPSRDLFTIAVKNQEAAAKRICQSCPVRKKCLADNLHDEYGVFGGFSPSERARMTRNDPNAAEELPPEVDDPNWVPPNGRGGHNRIDGYDHVIMDLYRQGHGITAIERKLNLSRRVVRRVVEGSGEARTREERSALAAQVSPAKREKMDRIRAELLRGKRAKTVYEENADLPWGMCFEVQAQMRHEGVIPQTVTPDQSEIHKMRQKGISWAKITKILDNGQSQSAIEARYRRWLNVRDKAGRS